MDSNQGESPRTPRPFGYDFGDLRRPQDPPGQPLLTNINDFSLAGFWDNPNSANQFLNFDFLNTSTPPEFLGHVNPQNAAALDTPSGFANPFASGSAGLLNLVNEEDETIPTEDVLGAASALYNNVHNNQHPSTSFAIRPSTGQQAFFDTYGTQHNPGPSVPSLSNLPSTDPYAGTFNIPSGPAWQEPGFSFRQGHTSISGTNNPLSPFPSYAPTLQRPIAAHGLQFGSDNAFVNAGFLRSPHRSEEAATAAMLSTLEAFEPQSSAASTQPASPVAQRHRKQPSNNGPMIGESEEKQEKSVSRKRRKVADQVEEKRKSFASPEARPKPSRRNPSSTPTRPPHPRAQSSTSVNESSFPTDNGSGNPTSPPVTPAATLKTGTPKARARRKSSSTSQPTISRSKANRAPRENLSEQQKKDNHIRSEKKRRDLITQGFKDLETLVPALKGGGISKSNMLTETATFLEALVEGNKMLKNLLGETDDYDREEAEEEHGEDEKDNG